ncbi:cytochrome P450 [Nocardiopsis sediminis]|uniref:Cytochrome P450 n=1 Tax=Nocardiopsis sediminis TaxID=1778267 RepID=A0ABV8FGX2_9ACTN
MTASAESASGGCPHVAYDPTSAHRLDPHPFYRWARENEPVTWADPISAWMVADHGLVTQVLTTPDVFSSAEAFRPLDAGPPEVLRILDHLPLPPHMVQADPPGHAPLRALGERVLHGRRIRAGAPALRSIADDLVAGLAPRGRADLVADFAHPFVRRALGHLTGFDAADDERLDGWNGAFLTLAAPVGGIEAKTAAARALRDYDAHIIDALGRRRTAPRDDILTELARMVDDPDVAMDLPDAVMFVRGLYAGGIHTTRDTIATAVMSALSHGLWAGTVEDPRTITALVEESLRHESPHRGMMRVVKRDTTLGGVPMAAGSLVLLLFGSANRDARVFGDPDAFTPGRPDVREHVAFGAGIHLCLGRALARLEMRIAIEALAGLPGLRLPADHRPEWSAEWYFRSLERLDVRWDA